MHTLDLRSDTVTQPSPAMREAIAKAEVGDDVYGEDPTVAALERRAAALVGKPAALLVPSGTMANQVSLRIHTRPGDVVLASQGAHLLRYEAGAPWALWGIGVREIGALGLFDPDDVRRAVVATGDLHVAPSRVLAFENTHNISGGRIFPFEQLLAAAAAGREAGLAVHLDGARLFNAVAATGIEAQRWAEPFDTLTFCLSKGLGAPVGSLVCGSEELVAEARRARKLLGGAMRQAGVLAAAGLYALDHHVERLAEDHARAARLARGLVELGLRVDPMPETNIVIFESPDAAQLSAALRERGICINPITPTRLRAVTHLDIGDDDVGEALEQLGEVLAANESLRR